MTTRPLLDKELAKLREQLLQLVRLADAAIEAAIEALLQQNIEGLFGKGQKSTIRAANPCCRQFGMRFWQPVI